MFTLLDNCYSINLHNGICTIYDPSNDEVFRSDSVYDALEWYRDQKGQSAIDNAIKDLSKTRNYIMEDIDQSKIDYDDITAIINAASTLPIGGANK